MKKIGFFVGHLHYLNHAAALCRSIRENTALARDYRICAVTAAHAGIRADLSGVCQIEADIPERFRSIPFFDKMFAAAAFENACDEAYIWMDVDSYFLKPAEFPAAGEIGLNPVDKKNIGDIYGAGHSPAWRLLYDYFQLGQRQEFVFTGISKEKIYPYYNAGMAVVGKPRGLFDTVGKAMIELCGEKEIEKLISGSGAWRIFLHQAIYSCAVMKLYGGDVQPLPYGVNYPFHLHKDDPSPVPPDDLISIRYDDYFDQNSPPPIWAREFADIRDGLKSCWYY